jgi:hypothetical protein
MNPFVKVKVYWDDTDMPYTWRGPRQEGEFESALWKAYIWGQIFCFFRGRASVQIVKI